MPIKAKKLGSKKGFEKSLKGGSGRYALRVGTDGVVVRFLQEPEEWYDVQQHFDDARKTSYPCIGIEDGCLACEEGIESKSRWYAAVYSVDEDRVSVFEIPKSVAKMLYKKFDRYNTITDRHYEITKEGTGLQTEYDVESMGAEHLRGQSKMEIPDVFAFVSNLYDDAMRQIAEGEEVSAGGRRPTSKTRKASASRRVELDDDDEFEDDDLDDEAPSRKRRPASAKRHPAEAKRSISKKPAPTKRRIARR